LPPAALTRLDQARQDNHSGELHWEYDGEEWITAYWELFLPARLAAAGEVLVVADDDMLFHEDFYRGLLEHGDGFDVMSCRILNPDGSRFWDWAAHGGPRGHSLMNYGEVDPWVYVTGGLCILRAEVFRKVQWDETFGFYQGEDVDFSERVKEAGFRISFNPHSTVTHNDPRYTQVGRGVLRK